MDGKKDIKEKTKKIYDVLPHLDDQRCGFKTCGQFARVVAEGKAPCYGCLSGGAEVAARVCEIMGGKIPEDTFPPSGPRPEMARHVLRTGGGRGIGRGIGRARRPGPGRGLGRSGGMGRRGGRGRGGR